MLLYLAVLLSIAAWRFLPRPWKPSVTLETAHHVIYSSAPRDQAEEVARVLDVLYLAYSNQFGVLPTFQREHAKLKVKLFKDQKEFRRVNPGLGWAEAFYREPYCRAYYSAKEINPYHWMIHEAVHQLNHEAAQLKLQKWLEEGLADYFASSRIRSNALALGEVDINTYPVWWIDELATSADLQENIRNKSVIPLRAIITNSGGPSMNKNFNLYYLHWWTLTQFIFEKSKCREHALELIKRGGGLAAFEELIGPVDQIQTQWHAYVRDLKKELTEPIRRP